LILILILRNLNQFAEVEMAHSMPPLRVFVLFANALMFRAWQA
jgi:hypothetical protein